MTNNTEVSLVSYVTKTDPLVKFVYVNKEEYELLKKDGIIEIGISDFAKFTSEEN